MYGKDGVGKMANQASSKYTEDWLPIKNITNGMIQNSNGYFITGVKVMPKNIFILDKDTQDNILFNLRTFYNMIDYEFWLIVSDRPVDISIYLSQLQVLYNSTANQNIRKLVMQDINKANQFMGAELNVVDTEYFILFKDKKQDILQKRVYNLISNLANCQLNSSQVSNDDLRTIVDNFFNGGRRTEFGTVMPK